MKRSTYIASSTTLLIGALLLFPSPALAQKRNGAPLRARLAGNIGMIPMARLSKIKPRVKRIRRPRRRRVGWGSGERMTFKVSLAGIWGGRAALSVGKQSKLGKRRYLKIRGLGETVPFISAIRRMSEEMTTSVWLDNLSPQRQVADRKMPNKDRLLETHFGDVVKQSLTHKGRTYHRTRAIGRPYLDPITALFSLRSARLKVGAAYTMRVVNGTSLMLVEAKVLKGERIFVGKKPYNTILVQGIGHKIRDDGTPWPGKKPRHISIWFTKNRARIPVKVVGDTPLGQVVALLNSYSAPRRGLRVGVAGL